MSILVSVSARLVVLCHPSKRSFSHAIAEACVNTLRADEAEVAFHDLYSESPDPVLSAAEISQRTTLDPQIQRYSAEVAGADTLVIVHPDWWGGPPALLKGWVDRVFRAGIAYDWEGSEFEEKQHTPLLGRLDLYCFITTDRTEAEQTGSLRAGWEELCRYSGATLRELHVFRNLRASSLAQRRGYLDEVAKTMRESLSR
jgi:putative NADPH-quinone reductase